MKEQLTDQGKKNKAHPEEEEQEGLGSYGMMNLPCVKWGSREEPGCTEAPLPCFLYTQAMILSWRQFCLGKGCDIQRKRQVGQTECQRMKLQPGLPRLDTAFLETDSGLQYSYIDDTCSETHF